MGYSEVVCHICGVSFNIGRIRTATEKRSGAWNYLGPMLNAGAWTTPSDFRESYAINGIYRGRVDHGCDRASGCMIVTRTREHPISPSSSERNTSNEDDTQDTDDETWVEDEDEVDQEPLEYCFDEEALDELLDNDVDMIDASEDNDEEWSKETIRNWWLDGLLEKRDGTDAERASFNGLSSGHDSYPAWYRGVPHYIVPPNPNDIQDEMMPLFKPGDDVPNDPYADESEEWKQRRKEMGRHRPYWRSVEHIAGPGCKNTRGYHGHEITEAEMSTCQTSQCLVRKPPGWTFTPDPDDEQFERTGEFFLSGLSDHMPSRDYSSPRVTPARHDCEMPHAENCMWDENQAYDYALPFHPYCFEIFKRTSQYTTRKVDVTALTSWWSLQANYEDHHAFPRDANVRRCNMQEWEHIKGTAYLVANPLYIPQLEDIFQASIETAADFSAEDGAFTFAEGMALKNSYDPFALLPGELQFEILDRLSSKDIANLRLSSRALCQIPVAYFQKLILREMPWLWEAWPTNADPSQITYSKWATATAADLARASEEPEKEVAILNDYISIVKEEMPELFEALDAALAPQVEAIQEAFRAESAKTLIQKPFYLTPKKTNYFTLYTLISRHWKDLQGLQNRKRVWADCEEILRRATAYREEGRIDDNGIIGRLPDIVLKNNLDQRRKREERSRRWQDQQAR